MNLTCITTETLGSFSFDVVKRILTALDEDGSMKRTNLALKNRLNYSVCQRYIELLTLLGWVEVNSTNFISITQLGKHVNTKLAYSHEIAKGLDSDARGKSSGDVLPETQVRKIDHLEPDERKSNRSLEEYNIILVDDEPDVLITYKSFLSSKGYKVTGFLDPQEALLHFSSKPSNYDLVILDIRMPNLNGLQLYQVLKAINSSIKILFVSALDAAKEVVSILPGVDSQHVIRKPVDKVDFIRAVEQHLRS